MDKRRVGGSVEYPDPLRPAYSLQGAPAALGLHQRPAVHQGDGAHARHEHIEVATLVGRAALLAGLLVDLGLDDQLLR
ncbi:hypothetical protein [Streptomyces sp. NPDC059262]|uniref:hypothetical protein n=1 Tax=Streptomyces sp. NPDC059262 TaxID=3346797 RepID=UPI0036B328F8